MHWRSFFWGFVFGAGSMNASGCSAEADIGNLFGGFCHYHEGMAHIVLSDPDGVYGNLYGETPVSADTIQKCKQGANLADGSRLWFECSDPVDICEVAGLCVDPYSGDVFQCEGSVWFE